MSDKIDTSSMTATEAMAIEAKVEAAKPMTASRICGKAASLVGGDRAKTHGDKTENHRNIARSWTAYLHDKLRPGVELSEVDAALLMALLKVERTKTGTFNPDDFIDLAGYAGVAGEIAGILNEAQPQLNPVSEPLTFRQQMNRNRGLDV